MYTLDEINTILSDLDACGGAGKSCASCSRSDHGRVNMKACFGLESEAAAVIRWLLSEFDRYVVEQLPIGEQTKLGEEV